MTNQSSSVQVHLFKLLLVVVVGLGGESVGLVILFGPLGDLSEGVLFGAVGLLDDEGLPLFRRHLGSTDPEGLGHEGGVQDDAHARRDGLAGLPEHLVVHQLPFLHGRGDLFVEDVLVLEDLSADQVCPEDGESLDPGHDLHGLGLIAGRESARDEDGVHSVVFLDVVRQGLSHISSLPYPPWVA
jgi:hypothetical protein